MVASAGERPDHTLQTTALVHEAYLRLVDQQGASWKNRAQFFAVAAQMMRRILVDYARARQYAKRGGGAQQVELDEAMVVSSDRAAEVVALDEVLIEPGRTRSTQKPGGGIAGLWRFEH